MRRSLLILILLFGPGYGCSTFLLQHDSGYVFGNNYDWNVDDGLVIVNKRGVAKRAEADSLGAEWVSRYGSVTVNQYGREMAHGGMNERGLAIGIMWLQQTRCPPADSRRAVGELEWVQYQLDNCATVGEVLATDTAIRIAPRGPAPIHYLVADSSGACAAIEFLGGRRVVHSTDSNMTTCGLTNNTYAEASHVLGRLKGIKPLPAGNGSGARFVRIDALTAKPVTGGRDSGVRAAYRVLDDLSMRGYTAWSLVYDLQGKCMHIRTRKRPKAKRLCLHDVNFGCETPVRIMDINHRATGDIAATMQAYTFEANMALMMQSFSKTDFLRGFGREQIEYNARIPETHTQCVGQEGSSRGGTE